MIKPPTEFKTARLLLRVPVMEDAESILEEYAADNEVTRYLAWLPHKSRETVDDFLEGVVGRYEKGLEFTWVLTTPTENNAIGMIGARIHNHMADIGYVLGRKHWRNGYMTEAISVVSEWMLAQPHIYRVWAVCDRENIGSARALEKSRFEREGILRRWIVHPNLSNEPRDCYVFGRVR